MGTGPGHSTHGPEGRQPGLLPSVAALLKRGGAGRGGPERARLGQAPGGQPATWWGRGAVGAGPDCQGGRTVTC